MQLSNTVRGLQEDLAGLAGLGGHDVAEAASRLVGAMDGPLTMRILDLLGEAADELDVQLPSGRVELRVAGREAGFVYVEDAAAPAQADLGDDQSARITLRLPELLKTQLEQAAASEGVSTNTWIVRALSRSSSTARPAQSRRRLTGYGWA